MAANSLPPLPPRGALELPKLPPRTTPTPKENTEASNGTETLVLPALPSRPSSAASSDGSSSLTSNSSTSSSNLDNESASLPPLPQRPANQDVSQKTPNSSNKSVDSASSTAPYSKRTPRNLNAFGSVSQSEHSGSTEPQPALPPRAISPLPRAEPVSILPPLPSRGNQPSGLPANTTTITPTNQPELPKRRTQSSAPNVASAVGGTPKGASPTPQQGNRVAEAIKNREQSPNPKTPTETRNEASARPSIAVVSSQTSQLPNRSVPSNSQAAPTLPSSQPVTVELASVHATAPPLPSAASQPSHNYHATPISDPMMRPKSAAQAPTLPSRQNNISPALPPAHQRSASVSTQAAPPPIDRSSQPAGKAPSAASAHTSSVISNSTSTGLFLGSPAINAPRASSSTVRTPSPAKAPLLPPQTVPSVNGPPPPLPTSPQPGQGPPPALPPSPQSTPPALPPSQVGRGPAPSLPPSRYSLAPPGATSSSSTSGNMKLGPQVMVTPSSPQTRTRSRSFDAGSNGPPPAIPLRSQSPDSKTTMVPQSTNGKQARRKSDQRQLAPPGAASSSSGDTSPSKSRGRKRSSSTDEFAEYVRELTSEQVADGQYSVLVLSPQKQAKILGESDYVMMYPIEVRKGPQSWTVYRRFKQFYSLDTELKRHHLFKKAGISPTIPPKNSTVSKKDPLLLESRRRYFQKYLSEICQAPTVADSDTFYMFIQPLQMGDTKPK